MGASPRARYRQHKANAAARGIEFDMTFREWWDIWALHFHNRGSRPGQMQMCRTADEGGYRPGNVRIDTVEANRAEYKKTAVRRSIIRDWVENGEDRSELREWVHQRHRGFGNPLSQLIEAEDQLDI